MRRMPMNTAVGLATVVLAVTAPTAGAARQIAMSGRWESLVNCAFTSYNPLTGQMTCVGSTLWTGDLAGVTRYAITGTYDVLTGDSRGSLRETFRGQDRAGGRGTIVFDERYTLDGAANTINIEARAVSGTGGFAGVRGTLAFGGTDTAAAGLGSYRGSLDLRHGAR